MSPQPPATVDLAARLDNPRWGSLAATLLGPHATAEELVQLAGHPAFPVRAAVAAHANTPAAVRADLAADPHRSVRAAARAAGDRAGASWSL